MDKKNKVFGGEVIEILPNTMFKVILSDGREVLAIPSGKMRRSFARFFPGDTVGVEMTPYDEKKGRIVSKQR